MKPQTLQLEGPEIWVTSYSVNSDESLSKLGTEKVQTHETDKCRTIVDNELAKLKVFTEGGPHSYIYVIVTCKELQLTHESEIWEMERENKAAVFRKRPFLVNSSMKMSA